MKRFGWFVGIIFMTLSAGSGGAAEWPYQEMRERAHKLHNEGNHKEAYELFREFLFKADINDHQAANDINIPISCLVHLNRDHESDSFREEMVEAHSGSWRLSIGNRFSGGTDTCPREPV